MMTIRRFLSANSRKVSDRMTMLTPISRPTITPKLGHSGLVLRLLAGTMLASTLLCGSAMRAQTATALPVIVADFNHDGIPDALVIANATPTATIAFGSIPYGTFTAGATAVNFPAGCTSLPQGSVVVGDFNNDGIPDIAFFCGSTTGTLLGNGDGTFAAPTPLTGVTATTAVLGDFNKDGKLDIAVLASTTTTGGTTQSIQLFSGNGDGTFSGPISTNLGQASYSAPIALDLNGDGFADIAMLSVIPNTPASVAIFGNNQNGTFGVVSQTDISAPNTSSGADTSAAAILAGNFFNTGAVDLAVSGTGANAVFSIYKNTSTSTTYALNDPITLPFPNLAGAQAGSFSGSGFTDLAASNGKTISVLTNDGAGNFSAKYPTLTVASTSPVFAVADANGDGYSDIYTATSTTGGLQLAVNVTSGSATATSQPFALGIGTKAISAAWNGNVNLLGTTVTGQQIVTGAANSTTVTSSKNPSIVGDSVTFSASVIPAITGTTPTGNVVFIDGTTPLATVLLSDTGTASYTTSALTQATHRIVAAYAGDSYFAASTSPVLSQVVNHAPAVASNLTWATPAAIGYGTALSGAQLNATATDAAGAPIPGTFVYMPAAGTVLDAGNNTLSVTFTPTDLQSFLPATKTVTLVVNYATPVIKWATPASIAYGVPLSATQLNATAAGVTGATLAGSFTYNPAAGTVLSPGTQTLSVTFFPSNDVDYVSATASVKLVVTGVTISSFTPNTANLGDPATKITIIGAGFVSSSVVQVNGSAIPTTLVSPTTLTAIVPASYFTTPGTLQITVADPSAQIVSAALTLTVTAPNIAATITAPPTTAPGSQPTVTITLTQPYPVDLVGTLTIGFTRSTNPQVTDPSLQFAAGGTTYSFPIPANATTVPPIQLQSGTIAGTITVPLTLTAGGVNVTPDGLAPATIVVPSAIPTISGMTLTRSGDQLTVIIHGFSNTREVANAKFHFTAATGASIATPDLTLPADTIFNTDWFNTTESDAYGSTFTYTQIFNTSDGAANIGSVDATLTNTVGASTSTTAK